MSGSDSLENRTENRKRNKKPKCVALQGSIYCFYLISFHFDLMNFHKRQSNREVNVF